MQSGNQGLQSWAVHVYLSLTQVVDEYSRKSFRLMALAVGNLSDVHQLNLAGMSQQQVEAQADSFRLLGLIVLANHVRQNSRGTVLQLQQGCSSCAHYCPLTNCHKLLTIYMNDGKLLA